jgi:hypothetical protein
MDKYWPLTQWRPPDSGARLRLLNSLGDDKILEQLKTHSTNKMTLQFERSTRLKARGLCATCPLVFCPNFAG